MPTNTRRDIAAVAVLIVLVILGTAHVHGNHDIRDPDALAYVCGLVGVTSLLFWRRYSPVVVGVVALVLAVYFGRNYPGGPALLAGPLSLLAIGYAAPRRTAWIGAAVLGAAALAGRLIARHEVDAFDLVIVGWVLAGVLAGQALRARGERAAAERERHDHQQQQVLSTERLRIAQDLHDSVAHAMATINVQSGVAAHLMDRQPERVHEALEAIRQASGEALDELGAILGALRADGADGAAPRAPVPGLERFDELVERARLDGLRVSATVTGEVAALPASVSRAAYRVVQEALTNTRRHAGPDASATIAIASDERGLAVTVLDDGAGSSSDSGGFGLIGMRERVESTGGQLVVGASPSGFRVSAHWPAR